MTARRVWLWTGGMCLLAAILGCEEEATPTEALLPSVAAAQVVAMDIDEAIRASGDLEARFHTTIAAEVSGRVTELSVDEGGAVERDAVVIEIDPQRRKLDLDAAQARLAQARANLRKERSQAERIRRLYKENVASEQQLEEAETALLLARSDVEAEEAAVGVAERAVADAHVKAPFEGLVARRLVELGEFVQPGTRLFEIVSLDPLEVVFNVTELDTQRVHPGQEVEIRVGAFEGRSFAGVVTFVAPTVDPVTRTLRIKAEVDNDDGLLLPGSFARVSLGVDRREGVLMVPAEALIQRSGGAFVFRIREDDRVERVEVRTGVQQGDRVEVRGPVEAGDRIVRRGHGGLSDGTLVVVRETTRQSFNTADRTRTGVGS